MQPTPLQLKTLVMLANEPETSKVLVSFFEDLSRHYADIRNLKEDASKEQILARQLLCTLVEREIISRLKKKVENKSIEEEYE